MIDVIIPCYIENQETLELTKNALFSFGDVNFILIDNGSSMGGGYLRAMAETYVFNKKNLGYAKAVNQGLKLAKNTLVAIANNDIRVSPNWKEVAESVLTNPSCYSCHTRMTDYDEPFVYGDSVEYTGKERWCTGSFFVVDRSKFSELYDESFLNTYDDWDYFMRVRKAGLYTAYTDLACYQHNHSFTQKQIPEREDINVKNKEHFKEKWGAYAEDLFAEKYPDQMTVPYKDGFCL